MMNYGKVRIGGLPVPQNPTNDLYVDVGTYITDRLKINDEKITDKLKEFEDS